MPTPKAMKIAIFNSIEHKPYGPLCRWATGYADYHVGFTNEIHFWDQDLLFRKRAWNPIVPEEVTLIECPVDIHARELDELVIKDVEQLCIDKSLGRIYGYRDYIGFGLRKLGLDFKYNFDGVVCSGRVRDVLYSKGWEHLGTPKDLEPSPADVRRKLNELGYPVLKMGNLY